MFVREIRLYSRALAPHLQQKVTSAESAILRVTDPDLLAPSLDQGRFRSAVVPELVRKEAEFDTHESGEEVLVRVKVPVTGDVELLEYVPEAGEYLRISAKITDDLARGADRQGDSYSSDQFEKPSQNRRSGFVLSKTFSSSASTDEIRGWARDLLDAIESPLPAMRQQITAHQERARTVLAERARTRLQTLTRVSGLEDELGKGV